METAELKNRVCRAIDEHAAGIIRLAEAVAAQPELGFKEHKTAAKVAAFLQELGYSCREGLALTGVRAGRCRDGTEYSRTGRTGCGYLSRQ